MDDEVLKELLKKYVDGKLSLKEAKMLKNELNEKKEKAIAEENVSGLLMIGLMLVGLEYYILNLVEKED